MSICASQPAVAAPEAVYPPPPWAGQNRLAILKVFGPGAIIASVSIASGETLFASRCGALFGYSLLWFIAFAATCKMIQVYTAGRFMVLTGEHVMEAWMRLPGPRGWFPILIGGLSILCFPFWMGGLAGMLGTAMNWIFGLDRGEAASQHLYAHLFGSSALIIAAIVTAGQSYSVLERFQTAVVGLLLLAIVVAVGVTQVDWPAALRGMFVPMLPTYDPWVHQQYPDIPARQTAVLALAVFVGAIGGGPYDYIGYLSFFRDKRWGLLQPAGGDGPAATNRRIDLSETNLTRGRTWLRAPILDVFTSFICVAVFTMAFNILGAAILRPDRLVPKDFDLLTPQVAFLTQIHPSLKYLYQLGIFAAFFGTIYGALEVYSRTAFESFRPIVARLRHTPYERFRLPVCLYAGLGGMLLLWTVKDPMQIVAPAALIGTITCGIWCFAMIWTDRRCLPAPLRMNLLWLLLTLIAGVSLTGFGMVAMVDYVQKLLHA